MKTTLRVLTSLLAISAPFIAQAQFTYTTNNGTITITGYTGPSGIVHVPSVINGLPVSTIGPNSFEPAGFNPPTIYSIIISNGITTIGLDAFAFNFSLTNVTLPDSITDIGPYAFAQNTSLRSITIPTGVTNLEQGAFYVCALTNITIPGTVITIGDYAFNGCSGLSNVTIANGVADIGEYAFDGTGLTNIAIPGSVTTIENYAFYTCSSLTNVAFENGLANIGDYAFTGTGLTSVTIPASVTNIGVGPYAFEGCSGLLVINADQSNAVFSSLGGVLFNQNQTTLIEYPDGIAGGYLIPNTVATVGDYAFYSCSKLNSVTISNLSNSVTSIGNFSFAGTGLTNVLIPDGVTNIGTAAFGQCQSLTTITVSSQNQFFGDMNGVLFSNNQNTIVAFPAGLSGSYTIPTNVISIGPGAFDGVSVTNLSIPGGVTYIGAYAFAGDKQLTGLTIPSGVTSIGDYAFEQCWTLTNITIPSGVINIGNGVFSDCTHLTNVTISGSVTSIGAFAFASCIDLTSISLPESLVTIGEDAFEMCWGLTNVIIPRSVSNIGVEAFIGCSALTAVCFYGNAPTADSTAFAGDSATAYYLPGTTGWGSTLGGIPTAFWTLPYPLLLNNGTNFGVQSNQFGFNISWATNLAVVVQASTNLASPVWQPLSTNTLTNGLIYFCDPNWTNYPNRFYRVSYP